MITSPAVQNSQGSLKPRNAVLVAIANQLYLSVERGNLIIREGRAADTGEPGTRTARFSRPQAAGPQGFKRLVLVGAVGMITLPALRWCQDVGVALVHIDGIARVGGVWGPLAFDDARLRRAQAVAPYTPAGLEVVRFLLREKLRGHQELLTSHPELSGLPANPDSRDGLKATDLKPWLTQLENADSLAELRHVERMAALGYWAAWRGVGVRFVRQDLPRVPEHWQSFGQRASLLSGETRSAVNPANALLNFVYAVAETECRLACLMLGLDPGMSLGLHEDQRGRASAALDILETVRPRAEAIVLKSLREHAFQRRDFLEEPDGRCRLAAGLASSLPALVIPDFRRALGPIVEGVAARLPLALKAIEERGLLTNQLLEPRSPVKVVAADQESPSAGRTPLTQSRRLEGRWQKAPRATPAPRSLKLARVCGSCGAPLTANRSYCATCYPDINRELAVQAAARTLALRSEGRDPSRGGEAGRLRAESMRRRHQLDGQWDQTHAERPDPQLFIAEIQPALAGLFPTAMARATGLSAGHCSLIRKGQVVPHPRHWNALRELADAVKST